MFGYQREKKENIVSCLFMTTIVTSKLIVDPLGGNNKAQKRAEVVMAT